MTSDARDLIGYSTDRGATCGCIWIIRWGLDGWKSRDKWDRGPQIFRNHGRPIAFTGSNGPHFLQEIFYKNGVLPPYKITLDWMKRLRNFGAKSWVHYDPPHSKLNCDQIEMGWITNHCKIWSRSPLECRKYVEEEIGQIYFNQRNSKPNLHINRVNSVIRSFLLQ